MGEKGFKQASSISTANAHKLSELLVKKGIKTLNKNFFNEFTIEVENSDKFLQKLKENKIIGGIKIDDTKVLVTTTEMNSDEEIEKYASLV